MSIASTYVRFSLHPEPARSSFNRRLTRVSHQAALDTDKALARLTKLEWSKDKVCFSSMPITVQASRWLRKIVGCAVRTAHLQPPGQLRCARRTLRFLHSNHSYGYAFRCRAALTNTSPHVPPDGRDMRAKSSACSRDPGEKCGLVQRFRDARVRSLGGQHAGWTHYCLKR